MEFKDLVGLTLNAVTVDRKGDEIRFLVSDGKAFRMYHRQDCCEGVSIEDISGDIGDLVNSPILFAEESSPDDPPRDGYEESYTWTFYRIGTVKGTVVIRWYGSSNGYYSESVDFGQV